MPVFYISILPVFLIFFSLQDNRSKAKSECDDSEASKAMTKGNYSLVEEKLVQPTPNVSSNDEEMMDIEEPLTTSILVQKNNADKAILPLTCFNVPEAIEEAMTSSPPGIMSLTSNPGVDQVKTDPTSENYCDKATIKKEISEIKIERGAEVKTETATDEATNNEDDTKEKPLMDKWFSLISRDIPLNSNDAAVNQEAK